MLTGAARRSTPAIASGAVAIEGDRRLIERFLSLFPMPVPCPGGAIAAQPAAAVAGS